MSLDVVLVSHAMAVSIPEEIKEELLKGYQGTVNSTGNIEDVVRHIAWTMALGRYTGEDFVEGVGSLSEHGISCEEEYVDVTIE